ncbi:PRC-barrel domain-containing protein [Aurantiacibacter poecillastricola]|uniref:PRC-barrel domain-containing protein n=1 Tax=Aurantiacibacter poecillastricola TaxID=3064385 RepID=UPI00273D8556|nr:PRC-barrel domain-containing protein [Aurantiacibacter sp. 219JJ12-13]MDP5260825.1 PRC-barrel domain-containing protein [Aurantiacibacter sp. 219JJ12-13]
MKHDDRFNELDSLSKWQLENEDQDIRGYPVRSSTGEEYGRIEDMLVDKDHKHVTAVRMHDGRLVSADHLDIRSDHVIYDDNRAASSTNYTRVRAR